MGQAALLLLPVVLARAGRFSQDFRQFSLCSKNYGKREGGNIYILIFRWRPLKVKVALVLSFCIAGEFSFNNL